MLRSHEILNSDNVTMPVKSDISVSDRLLIVFTFIGCISSVSILALLYEDYRLIHPFALFGSLNAALLAPIIRRWLNNKMGFFHPLGLFAVYGVHMFFVVPILWILTGASMPPWLNNPPDWRVWFFLTNLLYLPTVFSALFLTVSSRQHGSSNEAITCEANRYLGAVIVLAIPMLIISLLIWIYTLWSHGGINGLILIHYRSVFLGEHNLSKGLGVFMFASGWVSVLLALCYVGLTKLKKRNENQHFDLKHLLIWTGLTSIFSIQLWFGSRSSLLFTIISIMALHEGLGWKIQTRKFVSYILFLFLPFLFLWGFYKDLGREFIEYMKNAQFHQIVAESRRSWSTLIMGDLTRMDIQSYLLFKYLDDNPTYRLRWGKTYIYSLVYGTIPRAIWKDKPDAPERVNAGTDLLFFEGAHKISKSSRVYGLAGEGLLNFGVLGFMFLPLLWIFFVRWAYHGKLLSHPPWCVLRPMWGFVLFKMFVGDSDLWMVGSIRDGTVLLTLLFFIGKLSVGKGLNSRSHD